MDPKDTDPIDPKLEALLDEALGPDTPPAGLAERIVGSTRRYVDDGGAMEQLLDTALKPEASGDDLPERIVAATQRRVQPGVLGRIGGAAVVWRAAAAVAIMAGLIGAVLWVSRPASTNDQLVDNNTPQTNDAAEPSIPGVVPEDELDGLDEGLDTLMAELEPLIGEDSDLLSAEWVLLESGDFWSSAEASFESADWGSEPAQADDWQVF